MRVELVNTNVEGGSVDGGLAGIGAVREMEVGWPSEAALRGEASNHCALRPLSAVRGERHGKGAPWSASGVDREDERELSVSDVSKPVQLTSKPGSAPYPGISLGDTRLLPRRCPAYRQHEPGSRLLYGTCEGVAPTLPPGGLVARGRSPSGRNRKGLSTVAGHAGGLARSSCETWQFGWSQGAGSSVVGECGQPEGMSCMHEPKMQGKSFDVPKRLVWNAYLKVRENKGAAGVDGVTIAQFDENLSGNLYKLWNRMSSGSYFPGPVRAVEIPKSDGGVRVLGIPNVVDRIAQTVAVMVLEPDVEQVFHGDSYGYRPGRSALDAVAACREQCFKKDWVLDMDIRKFFDTVPWDLMEKAVAHHTDLKWILVYVGRWLRAPLQMPDGALAHRDKGTPQGAAISPLLANMFMHYAFDAWMTRKFPEVPFERYCDDVVVHCVSERQARFVWDAVARRLAEVGLALHPDKTRIVYCKDSRRRRMAEHMSFTFLGYTFRPREAFDKRHGVAFTGFLPGVSPDKLTEMSRKVKSWRLHRRVNLTLDDLAEDVNQVLRGWLAYFTWFYPTAVIPLCQRINCHLMRWARRKYKRLRSRKRARAWLAQVSGRVPGLFAHWAFDRTS